MSEIGSAPLPESIGRYRVERLLGRGAMGVIYLAHDPVIDRKVAIKLVRADLIGGQGQTDYLARFQREAQAAGRCMHANIVAIYDFALHDGNPYLAMEYVDGANLADVLRARGRLASEAAVRVALQMLEALGCAHGIGVVHRDVKPANILLLPGDRVKMTDFGVARFDNSDMTQDGTMIGTPSYMSPEQCLGQAVDARSDLFSVGAVLYEMLSGTRAFPGRSATEVIYRLMHEQPVEIDTLVTGVTPMIGAVLRRALAKVPQDRFGSAAEMAEALRMASVAPVPPLSAADVTVLAPAAARPAAPIVPASTMSAQTMPEQTMPAQTMLARVTPAEVERAERALALLLGPIAKVLVKRALQDVASPAALWDRLAAHIEREADRTAFLRQRDRF
ncbi:hypothetical protein GCM10011611_18250 [Aliidongia dinghuensis]|uniref:non-specific serine/threonine protein kinase n=1 Tax=Aliidongia dinghuensis TaxID=1867774 RepID=A0A8J2YRU4_9PROT|nr:serine/threonine-protein kinase [Aliidongia dinghuensis]GGF12917.1 hypothetical protein GCM10011611_18250 [Aliidongia dinghuensis]